MECSLLGTGGCRLQPSASQWRRPGEQLTSAREAQWWWLQAAPIGATKERQSQQLFDAEFAIVQSSNNDKLIFWDFFGEKREIYVLRWRAQPKKMFMPSCLQIWSENRAKILWTIHVFQQSRLLSCRRHDNSEGVSNSRPHKLRVTICIVVQINVFSLITLKPALAPDCRSDSMLPGSK